MLAYYRLSYFTAPMRELGRGDRWKTISSHLINLVRFIMERVVSGLMWVVVYWMNWTGTSRPWILCGLQHSASGDHHPTEGLCRMHQDRCHLESLQRSNPTGPLKDPLSVTPAEPPMNGVPLIVKSSFKCQAISHGSNLEPCHNIIPSQGFRS